MAFMVRNLTAGIPLAFMLSGCGVPTIKVDPAKFSTLALCDRVDVIQRTSGLVFEAPRDYINEIYDEIESRNEFTKTEMRLIRERSISVGMSENALKCSWGNPTRKNSYSSSLGLGRTQYVYDHSFTDYYVYVEDGVVTSWSKHER
jgi:hypothetical protein